MLSPREAAKYLLVRASSLIEKPEDLTFACGLAVHVDLVECSSERSACALEFDPLLREPPRRLIGIPLLLSDALPRNCLALAIKGEPVVSERVLVGEESEAIADLLEAEAIAPLGP